MQSEKFERWAYCNTVKPLLAKMLEFPRGDHQQAVDNLLSDGLRDAHAYSLCELSGSCKLGEGLFSGSVSGHRGVMLHTWLFHFLGGAGGGLRDPPAANDAAGKRECANLRTQCQRMGEAYFKELKRLCKRGELQLVDALRHSRRRIGIIQEDLLRQQQPKQILEVVHAGAADVMAASSDPDPYKEANVAAADLTHRAACCLAIAMGTHQRLGASSAVSLLVGEYDVLRLIVRHAQLRTTDWVAKPPPKELPTLRRHLRAEHGELVATRLQRDDALVLARSERERNAWLERQIEHERRLRTSAERNAVHRINMEEERVEEVRADAVAWKQLVDQSCKAQLKMQRHAHATAAREQKRELTAMWMEERERRRDGEARHVNQLEDMSGDRRDLIGELREARDAAEKAATDFERQFLEQQAAAERLRAARNGSALVRQAALERELKEAKGRRTLNQRRQSDANLADRRWRVAQEQLDGLRVGIAEYMVYDEAQRLRAMRADELEAQVKELQTSLKEQTALATKYKAVSEPPKEKFFANRRYTAELDLSSLEVIANLGVSANVVPRLFFIFANFFSIKIPTRKIHVLVGVGSDGKRIYTEKDVPYIPGVTHMKELPAIGGELHNMQVGEWLQHDPSGNYCYIADGANSQQREILAQLLSRRNKETGKLESMALSIDEICDKSSEGQQRKFKAALQTIAEAWEEADALGLLHRLADVELPSSTIDPTGPPAGEAADAPSFFEARRKQMRAKERAHIAELRAAATMNDRAAPARKAARLSRGGDGSGGGGDVRDDPTCAHHAGRSSCCWPAALYSLYMANIGEDGRKAIDKRLKGKMNISEEQSESDSAKVKALRTNVGWFSSPACSLIYQVCKYVALFSSKGYAIGENFAQWVAHKLKTTELQAGELIGHVEDLLAICGGRDYVFFLDAGVVERFAQFESLYGYLLEEADLGADAGGKLRKAIITGFQSMYCMAAVRAMAVISDSWLWPMLRAIEPGDHVHILDVCPTLWPRTHAWLVEAADNPQSALDGTLSLRASFEAAGLRVTSQRGESPSAKRRAARAQLDLARIGTAIANDAELKTEVHAMLSDAFTAMAAAVRNHASEFMPGGSFCTTNITPEQRSRLDGVPLTSVAAETMFARVKRRADRGGVARHDTRMGAVLCQRDGTVAWARSKEEQAEGLWRLSAKRWREGSGKRKMADERELKGEEKAPARTEKLSKKHRSRTKKAEELERLKVIELVTTYSALKAMGNGDLSDQLKYYKLIENKTGFTTSTSGGPEMRLLLQSLIFEKFGAGTNEAPTNDLAPGDSGVDKDGDAATRRVRQRKLVAAGGAGKDVEGRKRKKINIVALHGWEWDAGEDFIIERLIGKLVTDGETPVPGRSDKFAAGSVLYKVLWDGFPPEIATWEEEDDIPCGEVDFIAQFEAGLDEHEVGDDDAESDS